MAEQNDSQATINNPDGNSFLETPFNSQRLQSLPDIRQFYKNELKQRIKEISSAQGSGASKVFSKFFSGMKKGGVDNTVAARVSGLEIAEFKKTAQNMSLVQTLVKNPLQHSARIALAANLSQDKQNLDLDQNRRVMMHLALPIGLGNFNGQNASLLLNHYRFFQKQLLLQYQKDQKELKGAGQNKESATEQSLKNVTLGMDLLSPMLKLKQERINVNALDFKSLSIKTVEAAINGTVKLPYGEKIDGYKEKMARGLFAIIMSLSEVEFIHEELLSTIKIIQELTSENPIPFVLEGKIWMYRLQISVIRQRYAHKLKPQVEANLKKCLAAYGQGLKYVTTIKHMKDIQTQVFLGHTSSCLFAYSLRNVLNIPRPMYMRFLESGKTSLQKSQVQMKDDPTDLYGRFMKAFEEQGVDWKI